MATQLKIVSLAERLSPVDALIASHMAAMASLNPQQREAVVRERLVDNQRHSRSSSVSFEQGLYEQCAIETRAQAGNVAHEAAKPS